MLRLVYAVVTGLVGAALLHLVIILMLPRYVKTDAYARIGALGKHGLFYRLPDVEKPKPDILISENPAAWFALAGEQELEPLVNRDPFLGVAACRLTLDEGPVHLFAEGSVPLWSVVIFDRNSNEIFSMNDRTSVSGALDIVAGTKAQLPAIRKQLPEELAQSILVEMPGDGRYAILRAFSRKKSILADATAFLSDAQCATFKPES